VNGDAVKLTTYFSERRRSGERFLADALFDVYERHGMRTSVLLRGAAGFGPHHHLQSDRLLTLSEALPAVSVAVDTRTRVQRMLADVIGVVDHGLVSLERARMVDFDRPELPSGGVKLTVYGGRSIRSGGQPGYAAAIEVLRNSGVAGSSVLLAVDGTLHGERRRARFLARNAGVPLMLLAVGDSTSVSRALPGLAALVERPVVTVERVQICKAGGVLLAEPELVRARDESGLQIWQKLMVHTQEQSKHRGRSLHLELVRRLADAGAAGATVLRGVRGFYGGGPAFADSLLSLRRNVPVHVVLVDTPANMRRWWTIVDELTSQDAIVTSELVPALHAFRAGGEARLQLASTPTSS
jgi:PII-like signaling protein